MPMSPPVACPCGGRRIGGKCDRCGPRKRPDERKSAAQRGYDYQWQRFRKQYLALNPLCKDCQAIGIVKGATDIHHIEKLCDHPDLKYDDSNLMPLCKMHHDKRTARGE
jgi:5-methylcytosine-specific restriction enzyme A